jgi:acyl-CoA dehydrogenase
MTRAGDITNSDLVTMVRQVFAAKSGLAVTAQAEVDGLPLETWNAIAELGLPLVGIQETFGGSGGTLLDSLLVLQLMGEYALPLPLMETNLAGWLLGASGQQVPSGPLTIATGSGADVLELAHGRLSGIVHDVPWARDVELIVALVEGSAGTRQVVSIPREACEITFGSDLAGQPRDVVRMQGVAVEAKPSTVATDELFLRGALMRAAQMAGVLEAISTLTRDYVNLRTQFGRPIGTFQSVQQHVVTVAQMAAMASLSVSRAGTAALSGKAAFEICALKQMVNDNASVAARAAHQAHGAIGMTREYPLQQFTRRLYAWRGEFGDSRSLALRLGQSVADANKFATVIIDGGRELEV